MKKSSSVSLPTDCYLRLWKLFMTLNEEFMVARPHWTIALLIAIYYLRESLRYKTQPATNEKEKTPPPTSIIIPQHIQKLLTDLQLSKHLLQNQISDMINQANNIRNPELLQNKTDNDLLQQKMFFLNDQMKTEDGFYPNHSPSLVTLSEHLYCIKQEQIKRHGPEESATESKKTQETISRDRNTRFSQSDISIAIVEALNTTDNSKKVDNIVYLDPLDTSIQGLPWLRFHLNRIMREIKGADKGKFSIGLPMRSLSIMQSLMKILSSKDKASMEMPKHVDVTSNAGIQKIKLSTENKYSYFDDVDDTDGIIY